MIGGEAGGGGGWRAVGELKQINIRGVVPSVSDPDWHNSQGWPGLPLESL